MQLDPLLNISSRNHRLLMILIWLYYFNVLLLMHVFFTGLVSHASVYHPESQKSVRTPQHHLETLITTLIIHEDYL